MGNLVVNLVLLLFCKTSGNSISLLNLFTCFLGNNNAYLCNKNVKTIWCQHIHMHLYFPFRPLNVTCSGQLAWCIMWPVVVDIEFTSEALSSSKRFGCLVSESKQRDSKFEYCLGITRSTSISIFTNTASFIQMALGSPGTPVTSFILEDRGLDIGIKDVT